MLHELQSKWTPQRIKELRQDMGMSRIKFAIECGISRDYARKLEEGERRPSEILCRLLNMYEKIEFCN